MTRTKILIKNLDQSVGSSDLMKLLVDFGLKPARAEVIFDKATGKSAGYGIVAFASAKQAETAISGGIYVALGKQLEFELLESL